MSGEVQSNFHFSKVYKRVPHISIGQRVLGGMRKWERVNAAERVERESWRKCLCWKEDQSDWDSKRESEIMREREREGGREKARKEEKVRDSLAEAGIFFLFLEPKTSTDPNQCLHLCNNKNLLNKFISLFNKMTHTIRLIKSSDPIILRNILSQWVQNLLANVWKSTLRRLVGKTTFGLKCDGSKEGRWRSHRKV